MYKVFIQNKPLFFIKKKKTSSFGGISVTEKSALSNDKLLIELVQNASVSVAVLCDDNEKAMRSFFKDYAWVEAAGGVVKRKNTFLFIKRNGVWDLPKGKIDPNEKPKKAALREIQEECGIVANHIGKLILETYHIYQFKGIDTIKKTYWYEIEYDGSRKVTPQVEEGITKVAWLKKEQLKKVYKNTYPSILDVLQKYF